MKIRRYETPKTWQKPDYQDECIDYYSYELGYCIDRIVLALRVTPKEAKSMILTTMALFNLEPINALQLTILAYKN